MKEPSSEVNVEVKQQVRYAKGKKGWEPEHSLSSVGEGTHFIVTAWTNVRVRVNARKFLGSMAGHLVRALLNSVFCKIEEADHQSGSSVKDNRRIKKGSNTVGLVALRAALSECA